MQVMNDLIEINLGAGMKDKINLKILEDNLKFKRMAQFGDIP